MKKNFYSIIFISIITLLFCTACNGNVTRDIRHAGFNVGATFECSDFYPADKDDISYKRIRYFTGNNIIVSDGEIYEVSMSKKFTNNENCKKADTSLKVRAVLDDKVFKATDNKYYSLVTTNDTTAYSEITKANNNYEVYNLLLKDEDVVKVVTVDSSSGLYYSLRSDGNVYAYVVNKESGNKGNVVISSTQMIYNRADYGASIIDFGYAGQSLSTFVKTENSVYRMKITNQEDCSKYADIKCEFVMEEDNIFEQYKDRIIAYNGSMLITDYKQIFNVAS